MQGLACTRAGYHETIPFLVISCPICRAAVTYVPPYPSLADAAAALKHATNPGIRYPWQQPYHDGRRVRHSKEAQGVGR